MPTVPQDMFMAAIRRVIKDNLDYIPPYGSGMYTWFTLLDSQQQDCCIFIISLTLPLSSLRPENLTLFVSLQAAVSTSGHSSLGAARGLGWDRRPSIPLS